MSDALTPETPEVAAAVPEGSPVPESAVEGGSAGGEAQVVPAERFNGLMATYQREKSQLEARNEELAAQLESLRAEPKEPTSVSDVAELQDQVATLTSVIMEERRESALNKALDAYPGAKPFADLIVGGTAEEVREAAKLIHERAILITGSAVAPETTTTEEAETPPAEVVEEGAPETGGAVGVTGEAVFSDQKAEALKNKDFAGFLDAAWAEQSAQTAAVG